MLFVILWCFYLMIECNLYWNSKSDYRLYTVHFSILITCYFFFKWLTFPRLGTMKCSFKISLFLKSILILYSSVAESLWISKAVKKTSFVLIHWVVFWQKTGSLFLEQFGLYPPEFILISIAMTPQTPRVTSIYFSLL